MSHSDKKLTLMETTQVYFRKEELEALRQMATRSGSSVAEAGDFIVNLPLFRVLLPAYRLLITDHRLLSTMPSARPPSESAR
jgi:hypothetical protein